MRRLLFCASIAGLLVACAPPPEKVCARLDEFDRADPMPNFGHSGPRRQRPSKVASCVRQLAEIKTVDPKLYDSAAKCITKATNSTDAWDCWVLDHISEKQPEKKTALLACDGVCEDAKVKCHATCAGKGDSCYEPCAATYEDCVSGCQFP